MTAALMKYKERHDKIEHYIHLKEYKYNGILKSEQWYKHQPGPITEVKETILSDFVL